MKTEQPIQPASGGAVHACASLNQIRAPDCQLMQALLLHLLLHLHTCYTLHKLACTLLL